MTIPLLSSAYFTGDILIQGLQGSTDASIANVYELQMFINAYEEEFLRRLLGSMYEDFAAGIAAGTSKWLTLKDKIYTAKAYNQTVPTSYLGISDEAEFADAVPAGYILEYVVFDNKGPAAVLSMGTGEGLCDVFQSYGINAYAVTSVPVGKALSMSEVKSLFLNVSQDGDEFAGAVVDVYLVMSPLTVSSQAPSGVSVIQYFSPAANYVYFQFQKNAVTQTGLNGESQPNQENSTVVMNGGKMVRAWNKMVGQVETIRQWIIDNATDYPDFAFPDSDYLTKINVYGI